MPIALVLLGCQAANSCTHFGVTHRPIGNCLPLSIPRATIMCIRQKPFSGFFHHIHCVACQIINNPCGKCFFWGIIMPIADNMIGFFNTQQPHQADNSPANGHQTQRCFRQAYLGFSIIKRNAVMTRQSQAKTRT